MYQTKDVYEYPVAPDVAVIKGVAYNQFTRSWRVGKSGPAPQVVFEIASEETWTKDLQHKPAKYASMGVQEYFAYDPHDAPLPASKGRRLFGWRLDQTGQTMKEIQPRSDGAMQRLYDSQGQKRLTHSEASDQRASIADERATMAAQQAEAEARRAQMLVEKMRALGIDPDQLI